MSLLQAGCRVDGRVGGRDRGDRARSPAGRTAAVNPAIRCIGITPTEFTEFRLGLDDFTEVETAEEGLGPAFNGTSCGVVPQRAGDRRIQPGPRDASRISGCSRAHSTTLDASATR